GTSRKSWAIGSISVASSAIGAGTVPKCVSSIVSSNQKSSGGAVATCTAASGRWYRRAYANANQIAGRELPVPSTPTTTCPAKRRLSGWTGSARTTTSGAVVWAATRVTTVL